VLKPGDETGNEQLYSVYSPNGKDVWAVGSKGLIQHSPNGDDFYFNTIYDFGNNTVWNTQAAGLTNENLINVFFTSAVNGYAVGSNGVILKYSQLEGAPEGADILGFSISEQATPAVVDKENLAVSVEVDPEADLTTLVPELFLSAGATCDPPSGQSQDFTIPVVYTVTSADGNLTENWTVTVSYYTGIGPGNGFPGEAGKQGSVEVFPNPGRGIYNLQFTVYNLQSYRIDLLDLYGEILGNWDPEPGTRNLELDISHLPSSIYFLRISLENQTIVKKIIKL
jgi:hypothetical protein